MKNRTYVKKVTCTKCGVRRNLRPEFEGRANEAICATCLEEMRSRPRVAVGPTASTKVHGPTTELEAERLIQLAVKPPTTPAMVMQAAAQVDGEQLGDLWLPESYLATIGNKSVRSDYGSQLNRIARLLGAENRHSIEWSSVDLVMVNAAIAGLPKHTQSNLRCVFRGLTTHFATGQP